MEPTYRNKSKQSERWMSDCFNVLRGKLTEIERKRCEEEYDRLRERDREWNKVLEMKLKEKKELEATLRGHISAMEKKLKEEEELEATLRGRIKELENKEEKKDFYREKLQSEDSGKTKKLVVAMTVVVGTMVAGWWFLK
jgi:septal ring factor EnvC (AmiA/AmiB activator)